MNGTSQLVIKALSDGTVWTLKAGVGDELRAVTFTLTVKGS